VTLQGPRSTGIESISLTFAWTLFAFSYISIYHRGLALFSVYPGGSVDADHQKRLDGQSNRRKCFERSNRRRARARGKNEEVVLMLEFWKDLWEFMHERKKFWIAPIIIVMVLLGGLIILAQGSAIAPFIYTLF
jgi:hypothetical protein